MDLFVRLYRDARSTKHNIFYTLKVKIPLTVPIAFRWE